MATRTVLGAGVGLFIAYGISDKSFQTFKKHSLDPFHEAWKTKTDKNESFEAWMCLITPIPTIAKELWSNRGAIGEEINELGKSLKSSLFEDKKNKKPADPKDQKKSDGPGPESPGKKPEK